MYGWFSFVLFSFFLFSTHTHTNHSDSIFNPYIFFHSKSSLYSTSLAYYYCLLLQFNNQKILQLLCALRESLLLELELNWNLRDSEKEREKEKKFQQLCFILTLADGFVSIYNYIYRNHIVTSTQCRLLVSYSYNKRVYAFWRLIKIRFNFILLITSLLLLLLLLRYWCHLHRLYYGFSI